MKKLKTVKTDKLILKFTLKSIISSIVSILLLSLLFSEIIYKLDLDLSSSDLFAVIICALSSLIVSFVSVFGFKNNGLLMGVISQAPILLMLLYNLLFNDNSILLFLIKLIIIIVIGGLTGIMRTKKSKKIKV
jgi:putative membrane protein (TIGR04086 family)